MRRIGRALRGGLALGGLGLLALYGLTGGTSGPLLLGGILLLSLALNLWLLPAALWGSLGGWRPRLPRPPLPAPPWDRAQEIGDRVRQEVAETAEGIARALHGTPSAFPTPTPPVVFRCPTCGQRLEPTTHRCPGCGQPARFRCLYCGREVQPAWPRCPACGSALPATWADR